MTKVVNMPYEERDSKALKPEGWGKCVDTTRWRSKSIKPTMDFFTVNDVLCQWSQIEYAQDLFGDLLKF